MPLLLDDDYHKLNELGISYVEDKGQRFLIFKNYPLPSGLYKNNQCDVLVMIPANYNQGGNDMFWTHPRLLRMDGKPIPQTNEYGGGDNRSFEGRDFCRWSRHWNQGSSYWRSGEDDVVTIQRRIEWALRNPDAK